MFIKFAFADIKSEYKLHGNGIIKWQRELGGEKWGIDSLCAKLSFINYGLICVGSGRSNNFTKQVNKPPKKAPHKNANENQ